jgi:hypothetical protein
MVITDGTLPSYYIFNFGNDGFAVMPGDFRMTPLLAYGSHGALVSEGDTINQGLASLIKNYYELINNVRDTATFMQPAIYNLWTSLLPEYGIDAPPLEDPCGIDNPCDTGGGGGGATNETTQTWGAFLQTNWFQSGDFNDDCPNYGCSQRTDGRVVAGCVAIAMGQIMRYYAHPTNYNWNAIPNNNTDASFETAQLIRNIGDAVNMNWGCTSSGASSNQAKNAFKDDFGYSASIDYRDFSLSKCTQDLHMSRPVYLDGCEEMSTVLGIPVYDDCHAWVTDGHRRTNADGYIFNYLHMNWGWGNIIGDGFGNGWYLYYDWTPTSHDYAFNRKMIVNIYPNN